METWNVPATTKLSLLRELSSDKAAIILKQMKHLEKHAFPASEAMDFSVVLSKPNTAALLMYIETGPIPQLVAYGLFVRWQHRMLLHKVCVHSSYRRQGFGSRLMSDIVARAQKLCCSAIDLWVDEARTPAMKLYVEHGFVEVNRVEHYYGPSRTGIKMSLQIDN